eukprot:5762619-Pleurochrysis_carterae.AAC.1
MICASIRALHHPQSCRCCRLRSRHYRGWMPSRRVWWQRDLHIKSIAVKLDGGSYCCEGVMPQLVKDLDSASRSE